MKKFLCFIMFCITAQYSFACLDQERVLCIRALMSSFFVEKGESLRMQDKSIVLNHKRITWSECRHEMRSVLFPELMMLMSRDGEGVKLILSRQSCKKHFKDWQYCDPATGEKYYLKQGDRFFDIGMFIPASEIV